jgi:hypothetical protein
MYLQKHSDTVVVVSINIIRIENEDVMEYRFPKQYQTYGVNTINIKEVNNIRERVCQHLPKYTYAHSICIGLSFYIYSYPGGNNQYHIRISN